MQARQGGASSPAPAPVIGTQKARLQWTPDLHALFLEAVAHFGGPDRVSPKGIVEYMNVDGLTIYHVKSHLQKHRLQLRSATGAAGSELSHRGSGRASATTSRGSGSCSGAIDARQAAGQEVSPEARLPRAAGASRLRHAASAANAATSGGISGNSQTVQRSASLGAPLPLPLPLTGVAPAALSPQARPTSVPPRPPAVPAPRASSAAAASARAAALQLAALLALPSMGSAAGGGTGTSTPITTAAILAAAPASSALLARLQATLPPLASLPAPAPGSGALAGSVGAQPPSRQSSPAPSGSGMPGGSVAMPGTSIGQALMQAKFHSLGRTASGTSGLAAGALPPPAPLVPQCQTQSREQLQGPAQGQQQGQQSDSNLVAAAARQVVTTLVDNHGGQAGKASVQGARPDMEGWGNAPGSLTEAVDTRTLLPPAAGAVRPAPVLGLVGTDGMSDMVLVGTAATVPAAAGADEMARAAAAAAVEAAAAEAAAVLLSLVPGESGSRCPTPTLTTGTVVAPVIRDAPGLAVAPAPANVLVPVSDVSELSSSVSDPASPEATAGPNGKAQAGEGMSLLNAILPLPEALQAQLRGQVQAGLRNPESGSQKSRLQWTPELHMHFLSCVGQLGGPDEAHPSGILKIMNIDGLSIHHIKSHLQKHRLQLKLGGEGAQHGEGDAPGFVGSGAAGSRGGMGAGHLVDSGHSSDAAMQHGASGGGAGLPRGVMAAEPMPSQTSGGAGLQCKLGGSRGKATSQGAPWAGGGLGSGCRAHSPELQLQSLPLSLPLLSPLSPVPQPPHLPHLPHLPLFSEVKASEPLPSADAATQHWLGPRLGSSSAFPAGCGTLGEDIGQGPGGQQRRRSLMGQEGDVELPLPGLEGEGVGAHSREQLQVQPLRRWASGVDKLDTSSSSPAPDLRRAADAALVAVGVALLRRPLKEAGDTGGVQGSGGESAGPRMQGAAAQQSAGLTSAVDAGAATTAAAQALQQAQLDATVGLPTAALPSASLAAVAAAYAEVNEGRAPAPADGMGATISAQGGEAPAPDDGLGAVAPGVVGMAVRVPTPADTAALEHRDRVLHKSREVQAQLDAKLQEQLEMQQVLMQRLDAHQRFMETLAVCRTAGALPFNQQEPPQAQKLGSWAGIGVGGGFDGLMGGQGDGGVATASGAGQRWLPGCGKHLLEQADTDGSAGMLPQMAPAKRVKLSSG